MREKSYHYRQLESFLALLVEEAPGAFAVVDRGIDYDEDGLTNRLDPHDDNDGVADTHDAFPANGTEWADTNGNGKGDNAEFLLAGRELPTGPDPLVVEGDVIIGNAALECGRVEFMAMNGTAIARARLSSQGAFSITLSSSLLPDWFVVRASGGHLQRISEDGHEEERVRNLGAFRGYVGKHHLATGRIRVGPWTEVAYLEVGLRFPSHDGLPDGLEAESILDRISAAFPDRGSYSQLLRYGSTSAEDEVRGALRRGIVDPILAGTASRELADRVSAFRAHHGEEGIVSDVYRSRRIATADGVGILTEFSRDLNNRVPRVRQSYLDGAGALVDARLSLLNADDSAVRVDVRRPGGLALTASGRTAGLEGLRWGASAVEDLEERLISIDADITPRRSSPWTYTSASRGPSPTASYCFVWMGPRPRPIDSRSFATIPSWRGQDSTVAPLNDDGVHRVIDRLPVRILSNHDFLVLQFFREADRDRFGGVGGAVARRSLYLWLGDAAGGGRLANVSGQPWIEVLARVYASLGRVPPCGLGRGLPRGAERQLARPSQPEGV